VSEKLLLARLEKTLAKYPNLHWDQNPDNFESLCKATILVSDLSGIVFDFAFGFLKPVISIADPPNPEGFEAFDIPHPLWEFSFLDRIGKHISKRDLTDLPRIIRTLASSKTLRNEIRALRDENIANFGHAAKPIADEILNVAKAVHHD